MMKLVAFALVLCGVFNQGAAHQMGLGTCPGNVKSMENFNPESMNGDWFVAQKLSTSTRCFKTKFGVDGENTFTIQETRAVPGSERTSIDMSVTNVGNLTMNPSMKSKMTLVHQGTFFSSVVKTDFYVMDWGTDPESGEYAFDFECQNILFFNRKSFTMYVRKLPVSDAVLAKADTFIAQLGIDKSRMSVIDHSNCKTKDENDYNFKIDDNGISALGVLGDKEFVKLDTEDGVIDYVRKQVSKEDSSSSSSSS